MRCKESLLLLDICSKAVSEEFKKLIACQNCIGNEGENTTLVLSTVAQAHICQRLDCIVKSK